MAEAIEEMAQAEDKWVQALKALDKLYAWLEDSKSEMDDLCMKFIHADECAIEMANDICTKFFCANECTTKVEDNL
jgi:hypothetical protein